MHTHPVYYVSLLKKVAENLYLRQLFPPPLPVIIGDKEEFMLENILDARLFGRGKNLKYLLKLLRYDDLN